MPIYKLFNRLCTIYIKFNDIKNYDFIQINPDNTQMEVMQAHTIYIEIWIILVVIKDKRDLCKKCECTVSVARKSLSRSNWAETYSSLFGNFSV